MEKESEIELYIHCAKCELENRSREFSMQEYSELDCGWTRKGFKIWCRRHNECVYELGFIKGKT